MKIGSVYLKQPMDMKSLNLESIFTKTIEAFNPTVETSGYWKEIELAYTAKGRYYHNLEHLSYMLEGLTLYEKLDKTALSLAIFYHDIVYNVKRKDNEYQSAELAQLRLQSIGLPSDLIQQVHTLIMATQNHQKSDDETTNLLLDLDLGILGASWAHYEQYAENTRKEYRIYPDFLYKPGRAKVLRHFLDQPFIYKTKAFVEHREQQARKNLQQELETLKLR